MTIQHLHLQGTRYAWCGEIDTVFNPATVEESEDAPVCCRCHKRAMHWASDSRDAERREVSRLRNGVSSALNHLINADPVDISRAASELEELL